MLTNDIHRISGIRNGPHNLEVIIYAKQISPTLSRFCRNDATPENKHWRLWDCWIEILYMARWEKSSHS